MKGAFAVLGFVLALPLSAQTSKLDEGTFRVLVGGREVGVETFSIRQSGTDPDAVIIAQGKVGLEASSELLATVQYSGASQLRPMAFDVELRGNDPRRINAAVTRSRASARTVSSAGETMKEYLVSDGAVILDDGVAHLYYFVARRLGGATARVPVIVPRENRQVSATVTSGGEEDVTVGVGSVRARKITVELGGDSRTLYVDGQGRVLRVEIPGKNTVFVRNALP